MTPKSDRSILREGFIVGVTNPKAAVFFAAILPQFTQPSLGHVAFQMLILGVVFIAIALVLDSIERLDVDAVESVDPGA